MSQLTFEKNSKVSLSRWDAEWNCAALKHISWQTGKLKTCNKVCPGELRFAACFSKCSLLCPCASFPNPSVKMVTMTVIVIAENIISQHLVVPWNWEVEIVLHPHELKKKKHIFSTHLDGPSKVRGPIRMPSKRPKLTQEWIAFPTAIWNLNVSGRCPVDVRGIF